MKISNILKKKRSLSFEFFPPKTREDFTVFISTLKELKKFRPDFVSITDSDICGKTKHIALSRILKEKLKLNVLIHLTCVNNTENEIEYSLRAIKKIGLDNILALRGDKRNFTRTTKSFIHSTDLIKKIDKNLFSIGIAMHPEGHHRESLERDIYYIKKKIEAGAEFGITQLFFDNSSFFRFRDRVKKAYPNIPIICGIMPVTNYNMLSNICKKVSCITIPEKLRDIALKYRDKRDEFFKHSIDFSINQVKELIKNDIEGIHFFTFNRALGTKKIIENIKLI
jgi:methylenetetrahydrofolate reductase (NADPH)